MKGIDVQVIQGDTGLFIRNLEKHSGVEIVLGKVTSKKNYDNAEILGKVELSKDEFIKLSEYFDRCVITLNEEKQKKEVATVKFFEERENKQSQSKKKSGKK